MFGRRRHRAPVIVAPPAPVDVPGVTLSEEELFEKVRTRLDEHMGSHGGWTLVRRTEADTDSFFHEMAAFSLAREITAAVVGTPVAASPAHSADESARFTPMITVQTVPSGTSGLADVDSALFDSSPGVETTERDLAEHVMFELNTVAVWADPQRHDPSHVNAEMVTPSRSHKKRWNGTRVS